MSRMISKIFLLLSIGFLSHLTMACGSNGGADSSENGNSVAAHKIKNMPSKLSVSVPTSIQNNSEVAAPLTAGDGMQALAGPPPSGLNEIKTLTTELKMRQQSIEINFLIVDQILDVLRSGPIVPGNFIGKKKNEITASFTDAMKARVTELFPGMPTPAAGSSLEVPALCYKEFITPQDGYAFELFLDFSGVVPANTTPTCSETFATIVRWDAAKTRIIWNDKVSMAGMSFAISLFYDDATKTSFFNDIFIVGPTSYTRSLNLKECADTTKCAEIESTMRIVNATLEQNFSVKGRATGSGAVLLSTIREIDNGVTSVRYVEESSDASGVSTGQRTSNNGTAWNVESGIDPAQNPLYNSAQAAETDTINLTFTGADIPTASGQGFSYVISKVASNPNATDVIGQGVIFWNDDTNSMQKEYSYWGPSDTAIIGNAKILAVTGVNAQGQPTYSTRNVTVSLAP
jgi:hypothetical protein